MTSGLFFPKYWAEMNEHMQIQSVKFIIIYNTQSIQIPKNVLIFCYLIR